MPSSTPAGQRFGSGPALIAAAVAHSGYEPDAVGIAHFAAVLLAAVLAARSDDAALRLCLALRVRLGALLPVLRQPVLPQWILPRAEAAACFCAPPAVPAGLHRRGPPALAA